MALRGASWYRAEQASPPDCRSIALLSYTFSFAPEWATVSCAIGIFALVARWHHNRVHIKVRKSSNTDHCIVLIRIVKAAKQLREMQEAVRLHLPLPK